MKRPVFILCPTCRFVLEQVTEETDTPTATTKLADGPCAKCQAVRKPVRRRYPR